MNFSNLKTLAAATALAGAVLAGTAQAQTATITGGSSDSTKVDIGVSTVSAGSIHVPGRVGIGVPNTGLTTRIDFQGLKAILGNNEVTSFVNTTNAETDHSQYGRFDFAQAGSNDVWFGEWSQTGSVSGGSHTVYYGGTNATTAIPTSGNASYTVKGISNYAGNGLLSGTFNAAFIGGAGTLNGSLTNSASSYTVNIGTAAINSSGAISGAGASASSATATLATGGTVSGQFFGANVEALAGYVKFGNGSTAARQYDTAFGGTKN
ncbi:Slam-dependent surface lipoprotein [Novosphingobium guangzhouense]|uniref:Transferrin-binding protein B C-lobe/N-lobe beta barrel domain-containing protein n=1 Tax=Novosphingobium guangzhouense TaxID=1850347 RepID=A0A2K2G3F0_9SPHN|nr:Slam-dependent surface lipoprotein [Novosphingobium guangzhouense]PNU05541.1 hypothetical protein A8V01_16350 [Novosphingobium guangzhouense]